MNKFNYIDIKNFKHTRAFIETIEKISKGNSGKTFTIPVESLGDFLGGNIFAFTKAVSQDIGEFLEKREIDVVTASVYSIAGDILFDILSKLYPAEDKTQETGNAED